jgi:hypothetical protein
MSLGEDLFSQIEGVIALLLDNDTVIGNIYVNDTIRCDWEDRDNRYEIEITLEDLESARITEDHAIEVEVTFFPTDDKIRETISIKPLERANFYHSKDLL